MARILVQYCALLAFAGGRRAASCRFRCHFFSHSTADKVAQRAPDQITPRLDEPHLRLDRISRSALRIQTLLDEASLLGDSSQRGSIGEDRIVARRSSLN